MKKLVALLLVLVVLAACAPPTPEVVEKEVVVREEVPVTVEVEKEKVVEKKVVETVEVEKQVEVVVTATPLPAAPQELRVGISTEPWDLDPAMRTDTGSGYVIDSVYDPLIELDANREPSTEFTLMTDWDWNDDSTVLTLHLREGVKFHDGTDFDAADVKYNIDWMLDPENECPNAGTLGPVDSAEVIDDHTLQVTFTDPYPDAVVLWSGTGLDGIVPEGSHGELSEEKGVAGVMGTDLTRAPVGTGPFKFVEWVSGSHITVERFDGYWADGVPAPGIDQVVFEIMPDDAGKLAALVAGSIHIVDKVPFRDFETIKSMPGISTERMPGIQTQILYINLGAPPFGIGPDEVGDEAAIEKALNARRFLYHAVDRDQILDRLFYGMGTIQLGPWFPDSDWTSPKLKEMPTYDPALAQEYLDKSYPDGFSFRMMCTNAQWFCDVSTIIQEQLRPYGVEVEVIPIDKSAFFDTMYETFDWEVGMEDWGQPVPLALDWLYWAYYRNNHNHNHWHHAADDLAEHYHVTVPGHDRFVELYDMASIEPDEQKRKEMVWEMEELVTFDVIQADLMWLDNLYAWRDGVKGYGDGVTPAGDINLRYVTEFTP
jgi:ABC-type transport system substrate-binding protein